MPEKKTMKVRMAPGRTMPLPSGIGIDTNVHVLTQETEVEVPVDDAWVRRRLRAGDLVEVGVAAERPAPEPLPPPPDDLYAPDAVLDPEGARRDLAGESDTGHHGRRSLFGRKKED